MTSVRASATLRAGGRLGARSRLFLRLLLPIATAVVLLALALVLLLQPLYMHPALDAAGASVVLGLSRAETHALSDRTVTELLLGPGMFAFAGPNGQTFYDGSEAAHLRDVRLVLYAFLVQATVSLAAVGLAIGRGWRDPETWRSVARGAIGLAIALVVVGAVAALAFNVAFELFHRLLFPGGNWTFDPQSQRLVQLYPLAFWQITAAAMGVLSIGAGLAVWVLSRARARRLEVAR